MPQAPEFLRKNWHYNDSGTECASTKALDHLKSNFALVRGILHPFEGYEPTPTDMDALAYLVMEWDYAYNPKPVPRVKL